MDLVDYLHYLFEEDMNVSSAEQMQARDEMRINVYRDLYSTTYQYAIGKSKTNDLSAIDTPLDEEFSDSDEIIPIDPFERSKAVKGFIEPSVPNEASILPFGRALDAPLR